MEEDDDEVNEILFSFVKVGSNDEVMMVLKKKDEVACTNEGESTMSDVTFVLSLVARV